MAGEIKSVTVNASTLYNITITDDSNTATTVSVPNEIATVETSIVDVAIDISNVGTGEGVLAGQAGSIFTLRSLKASPTIEIAVQNTNQEIGFRLPDAGISIPDDFTIAALSDTTANIKMVGSTVDLSKAKLITDLDVNNQDLDNVNLITAASLVTTTADINAGTIDNTVIGGTVPNTVTTTALVATTVDINNGTIDDTVIGATTPAAITTTNLIATTVDINNGTIDDTIIGATTPVVGSFTTANATTGNITTVNASDVQSTTGTIVTTNATTGNITTINSTDVNTTNLTNALSTTTVGDIVTVNSTTGNIVTVNSTDVNTTNVTATGDVNVTGDVDITATLGVSGTTTLNGDLTQATGQSATLPVLNSTTATITTAGITTANVGTVNAGDVNVSNDLTVTDDASVGGDLVVTGDTVLSGNLTISGTTTTVNTETINLADNNIVLNSNHTGTPTSDGGITIERGTSPDAQFIWNETLDRWEPRYSTGLGNLGALGIDANTISVHTISASQVNSLSSDLDTVDIDGGTIDGTTIGSTTSAAGTFTSMTADNAYISGGTINNNVIGGATSAAGTFTTVDATTVGATTGNLTTVNATDVNTSNLSVTDVATDTLSATGAGTIILKSDLIAEDNTITLGSNTQRFQNAFFGSINTGSVVSSGGSIDGSAIGGSNPRAGTFTVANATSGTIGTLTATSLISPSVNIDGGAIDGTTIGATTSANATFNTMTTADAQITGGSLSGVTIDAAVTFGQISSSGIGFPAATNYNLASGLVNWADIHSTHAQIYRGNNTDNYKLIIKGGISSSYTGGAGQSGLFGGIVLDGSDYASSLNQNYAGGVEIMGPLNTDSDADIYGTLTAASLVAGSVMPKSDNTGSLGSSTNRWHSLYLGPGSLYIDGHKVLGSAASGQIDITTDDDQNLNINAGGAGTTGTITMSSAGNTTQINDTTVNLGPSNNTATVNIRGTLDVVDHIEIDDFDIGNGTINATGINQNLTVTTNGTGFTHLDTSDLYVGPLSGAVKIDESSITVSNTNGDLSILPNGTGKVNLAGLEVKSYSQWGENFGQIKASGTNQNLVMTAKDGTGYFIVDSPTLYLGAASGVKITNAAGVDTTLTGVGYQGEGLNITADLINSTKGVITGASSALTDPLLELAMTNTGFGKIQLMLKDSNDDTVAIHGQQDDVNNDHYQFGITLDPNNTKPRTNVGGTGQTYGGDYGLVLNKNYGDQDAISIDMKVFGANGGFNIEARDDANGTNWSDGIGYGFKPIRLKGKKVELYTNGEQRLQADDSGVTAYTKTTSVGDSKNPITLNNQLNWDHSSENNNLSGHGLNASFVIKAQNGDALQVAANLCKITEVTTGGSAGSASVTDYHGEYTLTTGERIGNVEQGGLNTFTVNKNFAQATKEIRITDTPRNSGTTQLSGLYLTYDGAETGTPTAKVQLRNDGTDTTSTLMDLAEDRTTFTKITKQYKASADPTGEAGDTYFNTATSKFRGHNGTTWVDLG